MGAKSNYESLRNARVLENQARLASLGLHKTISELREATESAKPKRSWNKKVYGITRRSQRINTTNLNGSGGHLPLRLSWRLRESRTNTSSPKQGIPVLLGMRTLQWNARRQKKLCGEEDCRRCGNFDANEPCLGKTDCSVCHSSTGVFCRACLTVRYGEEMEEVRENKQWMCPHCIEAKGINPYWICNSSRCLKKRSIAPTGIAIFRS